MNKVIRLGPNQYGWCPYKEEIWTQVQRVGDMKTQGEGAHL